MEHESGEHSINTTRTNVRDTKFSYTFLSFPWWGLCKMKGMLLSREDNFNTQGAATSATTLLHTFI